MKTARRALHLLACSAPLPLWVRQAPLAPLATPIAMAEHPTHAEQHDMARPQNIYEHFDYTLLKGERPLWGVWNNLHQFLTVVDIS